MPMLKYVAALIFFIITLLLVGWLKSKKLQTRHYTFQNKKITEDLNGLVVVQISDLHCFQFGREQETLVHAVRCTHPDIIVITGDLFDRHRPLIYEPAFELVFALLKIAPVFYVNGNHEKEVPNARIWENDMRQMGVRLLRNEAAELSVGNSTLRIVGLNEDVSPEQWTLLVGSSHLHLVLSHRPEKFTDYVAAGADIVLSGHAHGGQIRFLGRGLYSPEQGVFPKYTKGMYCKQRTTMIVSAGLGNTRIIPRFFNPPEIVVVTLQKTL